MSTDTEIAAAFFPSMTSEKPATPAAAPSPDDLRRQADEAQRRADGARHRASAAQRKAEGEKLTDSDLARMMFNEQPQTLDPVNWEEPSASAQDLAAVFTDTAKVHEIALVEQPDEPLRKFADAMADAGVGQTFGRELFRHAGMAMRDDYAPPDEATATAELQKSWGRNFDRNVQGIREAVQRAEAKSPGIVAFLNQTGFGNDPAFLKKVHASLQRRTRS